MYIALLLPPYYSAQKSLLLPRERNQSRRSFYLKFLKIKPERDRLL